MRATEDTPPSCAVVVLLASAARHFVGVAMALPRGSAQPRESLTQDSRSAVKARLLIPYGNHSARSVALPAKLMWRPEAVTWVGALDQATKRCADAERRPMRAYVTSG